MTNLKLKTGAVVPEPAVRTVMALLEELEADPVLFHEAVMKAREPGRRLFGNAGSRLMAMGVLDEELHMHALTRDVIAAAVTGDGFAMKLGSPLAPEV